MELDQLLADGLVDKARAAAGARRRQRRRSLLRRGLDGAHVGAESRGDHRVAHAPVERRLPHGRRRRLALGARGRSSPRGPLLWVLVIRMPRRHRQVQVGGVQTRTRTRGAHQVPVALPLQLPQPRLVVVVEHERPGRGTGTGAGRERERADQRRQIRGREALQDGLLHGRAVDSLPVAAGPAAPAGAAEPSDDVAPGTLPRDGGGEVGGVVEGHMAGAAGPRQGRRDLVRRGAHAVCHDGLKPLHAAKRRLHGHRAQVHALLAVDEDNRQHACVLHVRRTLLPASAAAGHKPRIETAATRTGSICLGCCELGIEGRRVDKAEGFIERRRGELRRLGWAAGERVKE
uniref:Uncharacterized protein n=1 Tax=Zea mays TaxID=4577 RepID=A0A804RK55_MAIZE